MAIQSKSTIDDLPTMDGVAVAMMGVLEREGEPVELEQLADELGVSKHCVFSAINYVQHPERLQAVLTAEGDTALEVRD